MSYKIIFDEDFWIRSKKLQPNRSKHVESQVFVRVVIFYVILINIFLEFLKFCIDLSIFLLLRSLTQVQHLQLENSMVVSIIANYFSNILVVLALWSNFKHSDILPSFAKKNFGFKFHLIWHRTIFAHFRLDNFTKGYPYTPCSAFTTSHIFVI